MTDEGTERGAADGTASLSRVETAAAASEAKLAGWRGAPPPRPVTLIGRDVSIVPYDRRVHPRALWQACGGRAINERLHYFAGGPFFDVEDMIAWLDAANGLNGSTGGWLTHAIVETGSARTLGMASFMRADPDNGAVEIGAVLHGPDLVRRRGASEAHYLFARHVFDTLGYRRYEWKCDDANLASKRAALRFGFRFEGVFRQHMVVKGRNRDTAWFAMTDRDWPAIRRAFEIWLDPDNHDAAGRQIRTLQQIRESIIGGAS